MKLSINFDVTQVISETWEVEVDEFTNLKDYITAIEEDGNIIFDPDGHPNQRGDARLTDSESYETLSMKLISVEIKKENANG